MVCFETPSSRPTSAALRVVDKGAGQRVSSFRYSAITVLDPLLSFTSLGGVFEDFPRQAG